MKEFSQFISWRKVIFLNGGFGIFNCWYGRLHSSILARIRKQVNVMKRRGKQKHNEYI